MSNPELAAHFTGILEHSGMLSHEDRTRVMSVERASRDMRMLQTVRYLLTGLSDDGLQGDDDWGDMVAEIGEQYRLDPEAVDAAMTLCEERLEGGSIDG